MKLASLINLKPLKEGAFGMAAKELAATYSLERLQNIRDEIMGDMEQEAEPEGGRIADMYADQLQGVDDAIAIKRGDSGTPLTYDQAIGRVSRDEFEKSSKFDRMNESEEYDEIANEEFGMDYDQLGPNEKEWVQDQFHHQIYELNESTEKSWNAIDVSRKAEKEIDNKEWNERTTKKLDMLKSLNKAGKFKKDWGEEKLQGWVDQNYSWEKLSRQFKLNESKNNTMKSKLLTERFQELAGIKPLYENEARKADHSSFEFDNYNNDGDIPLPTAGWWEDGTEMTEYELEAYYDRMGSSTMHSIMHDNLGEGRTQADRDWEQGKTPQSTPQPSATIKRVINLKMDSEVGEPVTVEYDPKKNLRDVTISWGNESHTVDFEAEDTIDDHGNEGLDLETIANSDDGRWQFILDVYAEATYPMTGDFAEWDFDELIIQGHPENEDHLEPEDRSDYDDMDEGSCGYSQEAPGGKDLKTPGGTKGMKADTRTMSMMREAIKKEIKKLHETN